MLYIEPLISCDKILALFNEQKTSGYKHIDFIDKLGYKNGTPESQIILTAINKLEDDGHLKRYGGALDYFQLGGDALTFKETGGYKGLVERENKKEEIREIIEQLNIKTSNSVIDTNISVRTTNNIQQKSIKKNEKLYWLTLLVAAVGAFGTVGSFIKSCESNKQKSSQSYLKPAPQSEKNKQSQIVNHLLPVRLVKDSLKSSKIPTQ